METTKLNITKNSVVEVLEAFDAVDQSVMARDALPLAREQEALLREMAEELQEWVNQFTYATDVGWAKRMRESALSLCTRTKEVLG